MAIARKALLFGPTRSMHSRAAATNGHGRPRSETGTKIGPDHEANKRTAPKRGGAIAAKACLATDLLFAVAQDIAANPADRRKAASQVAEFFLPKNARGKNLRRGKFPPDEYGFVVDPIQATELRDSKLKLACLKLDKKRTPYAIAQEARTFHARIEEIQRSLQCPCPSRYGGKQLKSDNERLKIFGDRRVQRKLFPPEEDLEEACRTARLDSFLVGPEVMARQRLEVRIFVTRNVWPTRDSGWRIFVTRNVWPTRDSGWRIFVTRNVWPTRVARPSLRRKKPCSDFWPFCILLVGSRRPAKK